MGVLKIWDGTAWQTSAASGDGASVYVGPDAPAGTPGTGDLWYDTDETSQLVLPLVLANGGTGAANASAARVNLGVPTVGQSGSVAGAPTAGAWVRGDQWLDSTNVFWVCTESGSPGIWTFVGSNKRVARIVPMMNGFVNQTTYGYLPQTTDRNQMKIVFTKRMASSRLLMTMMAHFYVSSGAAQQFYGGVTNGTVTFDVAQRYPDGTIPTGNDLVGQRELYNQAAGVHTFEPVFKSGSTANFQFDGNWELSYSVEEVP